MNARRLHQRWQASLEARQAHIRKLLQLKRALTESEVHNLRVALRRARLLAELGAKWIGKTETRKFRLAARAMLGALNELRDCDVALEWLRTNGSSATLNRKLAARRERLWLAASSRLKRAALKRFKFASEGKFDPKKLARRMKKEVGEVSDNCLGTVKRGPEIPISELHALRRKVRRWRYLRELEIAPRQIRRDRRLKTLIEVQESLGALQNAEVILEQLKPLGRTKQLLALRAALRANFTQFHREALQQIKQLPSLI